MFPYILPGSEELDEGHPGLGGGCEVVLAQLGHGSWLLRLGHLAVLGGSLAGLALGGGDELLELCESPGALVGLHLTAGPGGELEDGEQVEGGGGRTYWRWRRCMASLRRR